MSKVICIVVFTPRAETVVGNQTLIKDRQSRIVFDIVQHGIDGVHTCVIFLSVTFRLGSGCGKIRKISNTIY